MTASPKLLRLAVVISAFAVFLLAGSASARRQQTYVACDNAQSPDYPTLAAHPGACDLGLHQSDFESQPVRGRRFAPIALRHLRWAGWGHQHAVGHGLGCHVGLHGNAKWRSCEQVTVDVYRPEAVLPAGGAVIYQLIRVRHTSPQRRGGSFTYWYQAGADY
jgi:hypothetical protein